MNIVDMKEVLKLINELIDIKKEKVNKYAFAIYKRIKEKLSEKNKAHFLSKIDENRFKLIEGKEKSYFLIKN
jgi:hypothetical protein